MDLRKVSKKFEPVIREVMRDYGLYIILTGLFAAHFLLYWVKFKGVINFDYVMLYMRPLQTITASGAIDIPAVQPTFYQGALFHFKPFFDLFGRSPDLIIVLTGFLAALASPAAFLFFKEFFSWKRALWMTIILLPLNGWVGHHSPDIPLIVSSTALILFSVQRYVSRSERGYLYLLSATVGFAFYVKMLIVYSFLSAIPFFVSEKFEMPSKKTLAICTGLFLVFSNPFWLMSLETDFYYLDEHRTVSNSQLDNIPERIGNVKSLFHLHMSHFGPFSEQGLEQNIEGVLLIACLAGMILSVANGQIRHLAAFSVFFLASAFMPSSASASPHHVIPIMVYLPLFFASHLEFAEIGERGDEALIILSAILVVMVGVTMFNSSVRPAHSITDSQYDSFRQLDLEGGVATNHKRMYLMTYLDPEVKPNYILAPENWTYNQVEEVKGISIGEALEDDLTVLLYKEESCEPLSWGEKICGYSTSDVLKSSELDMEDAEEVKIGEETSYLVFS